MRRPTVFLSLLVLAPLAPLASAIGGTGFPSDQVIVRDCFGQTDDDLNRSLQGQFGGGTGAPGGTLGGVGQASPSAPAAVPPTSTTSPSRSPKKGKNKPQSGLLGGGSSASNTYVGDDAGAVMPDAEPGPETVSYDFADADEGGADGNFIPPAEPADSRLRSREEAAKRSAEEAKKSAAAAAEQQVEAGENERRSRPAPDVERKPQRVMDWGAKIFLSNDDSMSLASAQRVIYALQRGMALPMEHIRPHELLNYFSFDVAEPTEAQLFDVHASARQDGEQLTVALAVKGATPEGQPLDLTMVIDRSCSMEDEGRMEYTRRGLRKMADELKRGDRLDLVLFDDAVCTPLENFVVGRDDMSLLTNAIDRIRPDGATDLDLGLREGYRIARNHVDTHRRNRRVMVLTDAELNRGDIDPHTVSEIGKGYEDAGIRLTGVGVGTTFRDDVLDRLTEKGKGAYVFLGSEAVVDRVFGSGFGSLVQTIAHDVRFELDLPDSLAMERFYGEEASTVAADIQPIHYYAGTSQVFLQDLAIKGGTRPVASDPVTLTVRYRNAVNGEPEKRVFRTTVGEMLRSDQHNVNKAQTLMAWTDILQSRAMGADPCGAPLQTYATRASRLTDDAEIAFVNNLVIGMCGDLPLRTSIAAAPLKVRVDSDQPISHVALSCPGVDASEPLSGSDTIARFEAAPGTCTVTLGGVVDLRVEVEVPDTGRDLRCTVRAGRVHCG